MAAVRFIIQVPVPVAAETKSSVKEGAQLLDEVNISTDEHGSDQLLDDDEVPSSRLSPDEASSPDNLDSFQDCLSGDDDDHSSRSIVSTEVIVDHDQMVDQTGDDDILPGDDHIAPVTEIKHKHDQVTDSSHSLISFLDSNVSLYEFVVDALKSLGVKNAFWNLSEDGLLYQVCFIDGSGTRCEQILHRLVECGVGRIPGSSISIFPANIHLEASEEKSANDDSESRSCVFDEDDQHSDFRKSIKSRLVVAQVVESVRTNALLTFDYIILIMLASLIAGLGLAENSSVILVASMLISPLMGPILAGTFGIVIKNDSLRNLGLRSELIGLGLCIVCGFLLGLVCGPVGLHGALWGSTSEWPTSEMKSRGSWRSLWVGVLIALPSGAGVALSVLGGNAGSLVGVAISASLLPPAVNAGVLWAYALVAGISPPDHKQVSLNDSVTTVLGCTPLLNNAYQPQYSCNIAHEVAIMGLVSLFLTLLNIACIFLVSVAVLKLKEVAPHMTHSYPDTESFWREDIKIARDSYKTAKGPQSVSLGKMFLEEYKRIKTDNAARNSELDMDDTLQFRELLHSVENDTSIQRVLRRLPSHDAPVSFTRELSLDWLVPSPKFESNCYWTVRYNGQEPSSPVHAYRTFQGDFERSLFKLHPNLHHKCGSVRKRADVIFQEETDATPGNRISKNKIFSDDEPKKQYILFKHKTTGRNAGRQKRRVFRITKVPEEQIAEKEAEQLM